MIKQDLLTIAALKILTINFSLFTEKVVSACKLLF